MTTLSVIGMGLVSPLGRTPAEHALFLRADVGPPAPGAFLDAKGETIAVSYCPWLGAECSVGERLRALGVLALVEALRPLRGAKEARTPPRLLVCSSAPRLGLEEGDRAALEEAMSVHGEEQSCVRLTGEAGFFRGLMLARNILGRGDARMVAIVAADTFVSPAYLAEEQRRAEMPWDADLPPPAEGAAAILLTTPETAREERLDVLATIRHTATALDAAEDDNDAIIDGAAMTSLVRGMPGLELPVGAAFGQHGMGSLRRREWEMTVARCARVFEPTCAFTCVETKIGGLGAAAGAANLVHAVMVHRLGAWSRTEGRRRNAPFVAWAVSSDGTRGLCVAEVETKNRVGDRSLLADAVSVSEPNEATWDRPRLLKMRAKQAPANAVTALSDAAPPAASLGDPELGDLDTAFRRRSRSTAPIAIDGDRAAPTPVPAYYADVMEECLERLAMLARHRDERALRTRAQIEARILAQVDPIVEAGAAVTDLVAFWRREVDDEPWAAWAVAFTLGCLEGPVEAVRDLCEELPDDATHAALLVAEALVAAPHGARVALGWDLVRSSSALARVVGIELLSRIGQLDHDLALAALDHEQPEVQAAGVRAIACREAVDVSLEGLRASLRSGNACVAREAARALALLGQDDALKEIRGDGRRAEVLGEAALDLLVLRGELEDINIMQRLVRRLPTSDAILSAIGRFGHPATWAYLLHGLSQAELADGAHGALVTLFGPIVVGAKERDPAAWRAAIEAAEVPQGVRLRRGAPWSVRGVLAECASGELSRREVELRIDEVRSRTGMRMRVDLAAWGADVLESIRCRSASDAEGGGFC